MLLSIGLNLEYLKWQYKSISDRTWYKTTKQVTHDAVRVDDDGPDDALVADQPLQSLFHLRRHPDDRRRRRRLTRFFSFPEPISFRRTIDQSKQRVFLAASSHETWFRFFTSLILFLFYFYFCSAICFSPRSGKKQVCVTGAWRPSFSCHHHCRRCRRRCCRCCCRRCCLSILCPNHTWIFQLSLSVFVPFWIKFDSFILRFLFCFVRYAKFRTGTEPLTFRISQYYCWPQCRTQFKQNFSY